MMEMMEMTIDYKYQILKINLTSLNLNIKKLVFFKNIEVKNILHTRLMKFTTLGACS